MQHLGKDLYLVRLNDIVFADNLDQSFYNPRYSVPGQVEGFEEDEIKELYEGIRTEGLQNYPTVRKCENLPNKFQLIRGERRIRSIHSLIEDNATILCKNVDNNKWERPNKVYEFVVCHVMNKCDDLEAQKIAFSDNEQAVGIGEAATTAFVRNLKKAGRTEQEILTITGKKQSWYRDTLRVIGLDEKTFLAFVSGEINRVIAIELSQETILLTRHKLLSDIKGHAFDRHAEKIAQAMEACSIAEDKLELAEANLETSDPDEQKEAKYELDQAEIVKRKKNADLAKVKNVKPKATSKDSSSNKKAPLTISKINHWQKPLNDLLDFNSFEKIEEQDVHLVLRVCKAIQEGDNDVEGLLMDHKDFCSK